ncbi:cytochrome P450 [Stereum hirsutum FP-91666 SS1]|uniref:cytochrome P450 n=1 Tax=Stereum hirsutum (strain FP-91666) TaxID=721885 RepID=UPI0004449B8C|nr:cytochrome P450 [Stereum hirsutum FP-91666 SS1]EIM84338.1 cytochrome P450 [Stereum hirsutum FP-91666 SS1]
MFEGFYTTSLVAPFVCAILVSCAYKRYTSLMARARYPPGPPRLPIIGSLLHVPNRHTWLAYERMGKDLGDDLVHLDVLGSHIIVVNSAKAATELFEKRGAIYSDRPSYTMLIDLLGFDWALVFSRYGDRFRALRKGFHPYLSPDAVIEYRPLESKSVHRLLRSLMEKPENFVASLRHMAGAIILAIAFGIEVKSEGDPHVETAEKGLGAVLLGTMPQAAMYDFFPILKNMPSWFPGAELNARTKEARHASTAMLEDPMQVTKKAMAEGKVSPSVASALLTRLEDQSATEQDRALTYVFMVLGGADTTVCALEDFFLAMTLNPDAQRKAQAEIDLVVGHERLPDWNDRQSLPYVDALVNEVLRWRNVTPTAVYHRLMVDDVYNDYFLPAGATVIPNVWYGAILHDESVYADPLSFKPERFLDPRLDKPEAAFGFGRRICPGMHLALESVWIAVVSILASFDISKTVNEKGDEIDPVDDYVDGLVAYPFPFECNIKPRSEATVKLIQLTDLED